MLTTLVLSLLGRLLTGWAPESARLWAGVAWLAVCVWMNGGWWRPRVPMWRRQTPQQVFFSFPQPVAAFIWGFDVGFMITTYRVTSATWALWGLLLLGLAPAVPAGVAYALAFGIPAALLILAGHRSGRAPMTGAQRLQRAPVMHRVALPVLTIAAGLAAASALWGG